MGVTVPPPSTRPSPRHNAITPPELTPIAAPLSSTPSSSTPSTLKDSVELLLEGMAGPRPDRRKTTPQSDGEASAAYHAEHDLRRARNASEPRPKVMVERTAGLAAVSRERPASPGQATASVGSREALSTFVPARVLRRRVAMAVVAGVLIVLLSFMALRLTGRGRDVPSAGGSTSGVAEATAASVEPVPPAAGPAAGALDPAQAADQATTGPASPVEPSGAPMAPPQPPEPAPRSAPSTHAAAVTTRHHHGPGDHGPGEHSPSEAPADSSGGDLGEFKSKF